MGNARLLADIANVEILGIFWAALVFCIVYTATARWWETAMGRLIFTLDACLFLTLSHGALVRMLGQADKPTLFWTWFTLCSLAPVPIAITSRLWLLIREQYQPDDGDWTIRGGARWLCARAMRLFRPRKDPA